MYQLKNQVYVLRLHLARRYFHRHSRCHFLPAPTLRPQALREQSDHQLFRMSQVKKLQLVELFLHEPKFHLLLIH